MKKPVYVKPKGDRWIVKSKGAKRGVKIVDTQAESIQIARQIAINRGCELIVYRTDGTMRSKDSFGSDPFPPR
mgnify:CR=1 FL=1